MARVQALPLTDKRLLLSGDTSSEDTAQKERTLAWERGFLAAVEQVNRDSGSGLKTMAFAERSITDEITRNVSALLREHESPDRSLILTGFGCSLYHVIPMFCNRGPA